MASEFSINHFELFGLPVGFAVKQDALTRRYRELQQTVHPDRFANATDLERRLSMQRAAQINEAYQVLKDPLARARYLLQLSGIDWDDELQTVVDPAFLMEQMEHREALAEARDRADPLGAVGQVLDAVVQRIRVMTAELEQQFLRDDLPHAKQTVRKLQFLYKLRREAEELEADLEDEL